MEKIKVIIFDMDGVLVDTETLWSKTDKELLKRRGIEYNDGYKLEIMGRSPEKVAALFKSRFNLKEKPEEIKKERENIVYGFYKTKLKLIPNTLVLLKKLHKAGFTLALASSAPSKLINVVLKKFKLGKYFSVRVSGQFIKKGKPAPDIYLHTAKKLKAKPQNCLAIEDAPSGVKAAKKAGMYCIGFLDERYVKRKDLLEAKADLIVSDFKEINIKIIEEL